MVEDRINEVPGKLLEGTKWRADFPGHRADFSGHKEPPAPQERDAGGTRTGLFSGGLKPRR